MATTTAARLVSAFVTFALMARVLGPDVFGLLMTAFAIAGVAGLISNFGLATYALREIAWTPGHYIFILRQVLLARGVLILLLGACFVLSLLWLPHDLGPLLGLMLVAQVADQTTDLFAVSMRARGHYKTEAALAVACSLAQLLIVAAFLTYSSSALAAAASIACSRIITTALYLLRHPTILTPQVQASRLSVLTTLRRTAAYSVDNALQGLFGHVDSIILHSALGSTAVGIYQAGMRLVLGALNTSTVLGNVYIPSLSRALQQKSTAEQVNSKAQATYLAIGFVGGCILALAPVEALVFVFGNSYADLGTLMPLFGLLFVARMHASGFGMLLTALGLQRERAVYVAIHWLICFGVAFLLLPLLGLHGWIWSLAIANTCLSLFYATAAYRHQTGLLRTSAPIYTLGLLLLAGMTLNALPT